MRVLIDPGSHHLLNVGDVAMLQVCVERLRARWPDARIQVLTTAPDLLGFHCPEVEPLAATGRYALTRRAPRLPRLRPLARARLALAGRRGARAQPSVADFVDALLRADLLLMSGRGGLTDAFDAEAEAVIAELRMADRIGLPVALMGQGLGPLEGAGLRDQAFEVLPTVSLIAVREGRVAPAMLESAGVRADRVVVTGDDAIERAYRPDRQQPGGWVGLNVRVVDYSEVSDSEAAAIASVATVAARRRGVGIMPVAISSHPAEDDATAIERALVGGSTAPPGDAGPRTTESVVEAIGHCRVVVTGSYHAAVFALAQGIPAVGLAGSTYYLDKFLGLRDCFGEGCGVIRLDERDRLDAIEVEIDRLWEAASALRPGLLAAAERQIARGREAYARLAAVVG